MKKSSFLTFSKKLVKQAGFIIFVDLVDEEHGAWNYKHRYFIYLVIQISYMEASWAYGRYTSWPYKRNFLGLSSLFCLIE